MKTRLTCDDYTLEELKMFLNMQEKRRYLVYLRNFLVFRGQLGMSKIPGDYYFTNCELYVAEPDNQRRYSKAMDAPDSDFKAMGKGNMYCGNPDIVCCLEL